MRLSKEACKQDQNFSVQSQENRQWVLTQILADAAQLAGLYPSMSKGPESEGLKSVAYMMDNECWFILLPEIKDTSVLFWI